MRNRCLYVIVALLFSQVSFADPTHMGVEPQELVSLILVCETPQGEQEEVCDFKRTAIYGPLQQDFFKIPEGKALIVTEFDWKYTNAFGSELKDELIEVFLLRGLPCIGDQALCPRPPIKSYAIANPFGASIGGSIFATGNVQMTTGFAIALPGTLLVRVRDMSGNVLPIHGDFAELQATVRGYLVTVTCGIPGAPPCR